MKTSLLTALILALCTLPFALAGCGGGGSGGGGGSVSPKATATPKATPTATVSPNANANFKLAVKGANGNYTGPDFKAPGRFDLQSATLGSSTASCSITQKTTTPIFSEHETTLVSLTLAGTLKQGEVLLINPPASSAASPVTAYVSDDNYSSDNFGGEPHNTVLSYRWDSASPDDSGQVTVQSLSATSVTLRVQNVVLSAAADTATTGTITLNGTITATLTK